MHITDHKIVNYVIYIIIALDYISLLKKLHQNLYLEFLLLMDLNLFFNFVIIANYYYQLLYFRYFNSKNHNLYTFLPLSILRLFI